MTHHPFLGHPFEAECAAQEKGHREARTKARKQAADLDEEVQEISKTPRGAPKKKRRVATPDQVRFPLNHYDTDPGSVDGSDVEDFDRELNVQVEDAMESEDEESVAEPPLVS